MKQSVVAIIKGGLGNQLFAYAAARAFAIRRKRDLFLDGSSGFARDGYGRSYRLDLFPVAAEEATGRQVLGDPKKPYHRLVRSLSRLLPRNSSPYLSEKVGKPVDQLLGFHSQRSTIILNGYWQNEIYFADYADRIRPELEPPAFGPGAAQDLEQEIATSPTVSVHIRRDRYSPRLTAGYYQSSIHDAASSIQDCRFEIFGDHLDWARENLDFAGAAARFHESDSDNELQDFRLLAACRHAIVANSSFSWWGAWLRSEQDKRVWTPATPGWPLVPAPGWIKVPNRLEP